MENFTLYNPTKLHFGADVLDKLPNSISKYGKNVLLIYGKDSIKKSGLYSHLLQILSNFNVIEYGGIKANPLVSDANAAAKLAHEHTIDVILAVGGGSVIDTGKMVALGAVCDHDIWDFMLGNKKPQKALPIVAVLTLAATGTEMNMFAVLQNENTQQKLGYGHPFIYPSESFLDPKLTYTVPQNHTTNGIADLIAHCLEGYFGVGDAKLSDRIVFAILKDTIDFSSKLLLNPTDYELRARMMYAATLALNGTTNYGRAYGDWGVHDLGHALSMLFDCAHGASLSTVYPAWMKLFKPAINDKLELLGKEVFGVATADECIQKFEDFLVSINAPIRLKSLRISDVEKQRILAYYQTYKPNGRAHKLSNIDYITLVDLMSS